MTLTHRVDIAVVTKLTHARVFDPGTDGWVYICASKYVRYHTSNFTLCDIYIKVALCTLETI